VAEAASRGALPLLHVQEAGAYRHCEHADEHAAAAEGEAYSRRGGGAVEGHHAWCAVAHDAWRDAAAAASCAAVAMRQVHAVADASYDEKAARGVAAAVGGSRVRVASPIDVPVRYEDVCRVDRAGDRQGQGVEGEADRREQAACVREDREVHGAAAGAGAGVAEGQAQARQRRQTVVGVPVRRATVRVAWRSAPSAMDATWCVRVPLSFPPVRSTATGFLSAAAAAAAVSRASLPVGDAKSREEQRTAQRPQEQRQGSSHRTYTHHLCLPVRWSTSQSVPLPRRPVLPACSAPATAGVRPHQQPRSP
jgi:hypothetical protein